MFVTVDERDARPLYQQLVDEIKTLIARGELAEGTLLPPVRQVASDLGCEPEYGCFCLSEIAEGRADSGQAWLGCGRHLSNAQGEA